MYTIGALARKAQISTDSVHFYQRQGLLPKAVKNASGYRLFDESALARIVFIKHAQRCGFSLAEIKDLLQIDESCAESVREVRDVVDRKAASVAESLSALKEMALALSTLVPPPQHREIAQYAPDAQTARTLERELYQRTQLA
jgi:DNA-binding transcriptional MerR regulator